jgi:8-oxo-dGTP pyrophosphatase MutT (NUDIX family)
MNHWQVLKSEDVSLNEWMPITKDSVHLPDKNITIDYYTVNIKDVALIIPVLKSGHILFVKQYKHGSRDFMIELPGGFKQDGKSIKQTIKSELNEECGINTPLESIEELGSWYASPSKLTNRIYIFYALDLEINATQSFDENEEIELIKIKPKEAIQYILEGKIDAADTIASIFLFKEKHPNLFN